MANNSKKYVSLSALSTFFENAKGLFATKAELVTKADSDHSHNELYYTESEIDNMDFIGTNDIDNICETSIQIVNANGVKF